MNNSKSQQHYRLKLDEAIAHYQKGWITATALLYYYLKIRLASGWKCTLHQREISHQLGIPKTSFYRALENLSAEGLIDWEAPNGLVVSLPQMELSPTNGTAVPQMGLSPTNGTAVPQMELKSHLWDSSPTNGTNTSPKPASSKAGGPSSDSYQIFIWLANDNKAGQNRWEVYYQNFQRTQKKEIGSIPQTSLRDEIEQRRRVVLEKYKELQAAAGDEP